MGLVGHLDADCFYVSCERVRCPALRGQPAGVLGNQGACVIAKSYEMRACGVKTGMPIWDAVKLCPHGVYIKRDFKWYEVLSRQILQILREVSPIVEYYSIDEMFFDATTLPQTFRVPVLDAAQMLQLRILSRTGIPVSIGISLSKSLAKLASDSSKPFGCTVLTEKEDIDTFLASRPVEDITGIAERSRRKLEPYGIVTCLDFARANRLLIRKLLTRKGEALWYELNGDAVAPILTKRPAHKTLSRGGSLGVATADPDRLAAWVVRNVERLIEELDFHQVYTERLVLILALKAGGYWFRRVELPEPTARFDLLVSIAKELLQEGMGEVISGMHLIAEKLCFRSHVQRSLFHQPDLLSDRVADVKRRVNEQVGRFAVRSGDTLFLPETYADPAQQYDVCDIRGKMCF
jgi:nucleotidyltransferase/DNA polymerase involved in DNA repair